MRVWPGNPLGMSPSPGLHTRAPSPPTGIARIVLGVLLGLLLSGAGEVPSKPPAPTLDGGLLTVRVDPAHPDLHLDWDVSGVVGAVGIHYEASLGPFADRNPWELSAKSLLNGHFSGVSGSEALDLRGLPEGEYFVRYLAVDRRGRPVSLASDPVRFVVIAGGDSQPGSPGRPSSYPADPRLPATPRSFPSPQTPAQSAMHLSLEPGKATVALGDTVQFRAPAAGATWRVVEGSQAGTVEAGLYRAPAELPGGPRALTGAATVEARLPDGRVAVARVLLLRPRTSGP